MSEKEREREREERWREKERENNFRAAERVLMASLKLSGPTQQNFLLLLLTTSHFHPSHMFEGKAVEGKGININLLHRRSKKVYSTGPRKLKNEKRANDK